MVAVNTSDPLSYSNRGLHGALEFCRPVRNSAIYDKSFIVKDTIGPVMKKLTAIPAVLRPADHNIVKGSLTYILQWTIAVGNRFAGSLP